MSQFSRGSRQASRSRIMTTGSGAPDGDSASGSETPDPTPLGPSTIVLQHPRFSKPATKEFPFFSHASSNATACNSVSSSAPFFDVAQFRLQPFRRGKMGMKKRYLKSRSSAFHEAEAGVPETTQLKELDTENSRLKELLAEQRSKTTSSKTLCEQSGGRTSTA